MSRSFSSTLNLWFEKDSLTRNDAIARLQLNDYDTFKGLDNITLSRWLSGKSTPSIYKQMLICNSLNRDLIEFIKEIDTDRVRLSMKKSKVISEFIRLLDYINPKSIYVKGSLSPRVIVDVLDFYQYSNMFGDFYNNIHALRTFTNQLQGLGDDVSYPCIRIMNDEGDMLGHWVSIEPLERIQKLSSFLPLNANEIDSGFLLHVASFQNSKHFFYLISIGVCYYLLSPRFKGKRTVYLLLSGYSAYELTKLVFDAKDVKYYPPVEKDSRLGVHLVKVDIFRVIANQFVLSLIKERLKCLDNCSKSCNLCNLRNYL